MIYKRRDIAMTTYEPYMCEIVSEMMEVGATLDDLAKLFEIDLATLNDWRNQYPEFDQIIKAKLACSDDSLEKRSKKKLSKAKAKELAIKKGQVYTNSASMAVMSIRDIADPNAYLTGDLDHSPDITVLHEEIKKQVAQILGGDTSSSEIALVAQAKTLELLFNDMIRKSVTTSDIVSARFYMDMALRAQNQCRKTLLALGTLKYPPQKQVVEQQNIAINQQVNNGMPINNVVLEQNRQKINSTNELLEQHNEQRLDSRAALKTVSINSSLEALEVSRS
jgi:hypothetical protein